MSSGQAAGTSTAATSFDIALAGAIQDGVLTGTEVEMLANLAVALGLDRTSDAAKARVFGLLAGKSVQIDLSK